jgi:hypothetical protein
MNKQKLSAFTVDALTAAGWYEGRRLPCQIETEFLNQQGIAVSESAAAILIELLAISLSVGGGGVTNMTFDPKGAYAAIDPECLDDLRRLVGEDVCPIGVGGRFVLYATPTGKIAFLQDEWLTAFSFSTIEEAVEWICVPAHDSSSPIALT